MLMADNRSEVSMASPTFRCTTNKFHHRRSNSESQSTFLNIFKREERTARSTLAAFYSSAKLAPSISVAVVEGFEQRVDDHCVWYAIHVYPSPIIIPDSDSMPIPRKSYSIFRRYEDVVDFAQRLEAEMPFFKSKHYVMQLMRYITTHPDKMENTSSTPRWRPFADTIAYDADCVHRKSGLNKFFHGLFATESALSRCRLVSEFFGIWKMDLEVHLLQENKDPLALRSLITHPFQQRQERQEQPLPSLPQQRQALAKCLPRAPQQSKPEKILPTVAAMPLRLMSFDSHSFSSYSTSSDQLTSPIWSSSSSTLTSPTSPDFRTRKAVDPPYGAASSRSLEDLLTPLSSLCPPSPPGSSYHSSDDEIEDDEDDGSDNEESYNGDTEDSDESSDDISVEEMFVGACKKSTSFQNLGESLIRLGHLPTVSPIVINNTVPRAQEMPSSAVHGAPTRTPPSNGIRPSQAKPSTDSLGGQRPSSLCQDVPRSYTVTHRSSSSTPSFSPYSLRGTALPISIPKFPYASQQQRCTSPSSPLSICPVLSAYEDVEEQRPRLYSMIKTVCSAGSPLSSSPPTPAPLSSKPPFSTTSCSTSAWASPPLREKSTAQRSIIQSKIGLDTTTPTMLTTARSDAPPLPEPVVLIHRSQSVVQVSSHLDLPPANVLQKTRTQIFPSSRQAIPSSMTTTEGTRKRVSGARPMTTCHVPSKPGFSILKNGSAVARQLKGAQGQSQGQVPGGGRFSKHKKQESLDVPTRCETMSPLPGARPRVGVGAGAGFFLSQFPGAFVATFKIVVDPEQIVALQVMEKDEDFTLSVPDLRLRVRKKFEKMEMPLPEDFELVWISWSGSRIVLKNDEELRKAIFSSANNKVTLRCTFA